MVMSIKDDMKTAALQRPGARVFSRIGGVE